jgi:hypothetical protein
MFSRSTLFTESIRKEQYRLPAFLFFFRRSVFRAFRGAAFCVPFLAGQKGDIPTDPTGEMAA